VARTQEQ